MSPTYKNSNTTAYVQDNIRIEPKESESTVVWLPSLASGITKASDSPYYDPILSSAVYTSGTNTITVPATVTGNYQIEIYSAATGGTGTIKYNSSDATARSIVAGDKVVETCLSRTVDSIILTVSSGSISVTIKKN